MSSINKWLLLAVGVLLTISLVEFGLIINSKTVPMQQSSISQTDTISKSLTGNSYKQYDNTEKSGSEVLSAIDTKASKDVLVEVQTKDGTTITYTSSSYNLKQSDPGYIVPDQMFTSQISKTTNGTVNQITFVQE